MKTTIHLPPKNAVRSAALQTGELTAADVRRLLDDAVENRKVILSPFEIREGAMKDKDGADGNRTIDIIFSAGAEYRQWWGREKLVVSKDACILDRLNARIAPVLHNHDRDQTIGIVEKAWIDGEQALAQLRFSRSDYADDIYQDILDDIRRQFSNGYRILKYEIDESNARDPLYTITKWEPYEISVVAYAADPECQPVNRSDILLPLSAEQRSDKPESPPTETNEEEIPDMDPKEALRIAREANLPEFGTRAIEEGWTQETLEALIAHEQARAAAEAERAAAAPEAEPTPAEPTPADPPAASQRSDDGGSEEGGDPEAADPEAAAADSARVQRIYDLGAEHNQRELALEAMIDPNCTAEEFATRLLALNERNKERAEAEFNLPERITMDPKDQASFRISDLIHHLASGGRSKRGGKEYDMCQDEAKLRTRQGIETEGTPIPPQIFSDRSLYHNNTGLFLEHRLLSATQDTGASGGHTIDDELLADGFIDILLEFHAAIQLVTKLPDLMGNITFPRLSSRSEAYWTGEVQAATETTAQFDTVTLEPHHLRAWSEISTTLLHQSSLPIEQLVRRDLARALAKAWDAAILLGSGNANQISGINSISSLANAQWPADTGSTSNFNYDALLEAEELLANEDALMGRLAWIVSPRIRRYGRKTAELGDGTSRPIWRMGRMLDYEAYVTTQVPTEVGFFGNWEEMMAGMWGGIDVLVNPYSKDKEGIVRITTGQMCDVASRHDESFCKLSKAA